MKKAIEILTLAKWGVYDNFHRTLTPYQRRKAWKKLAHAIGYLHEQDGNEMRGFLTASMTMKEEGEIRAKIWGRM